MTYKEMSELQAAPFRYKKVLAEGKAREFYEEIVENRGQQVHVSVGGLDSITLLLFLRSIGLDVPAISVSTLEDKSIQWVHKQLGVEVLAPYKSKVDVLNDFGFPVVSKGKAAKIEQLQNPDSLKQTFIHAIMTGDMGEQGGFEHSDQIKLQDKWLKLFGGHYQSHRQDIRCGGR